MKDNKRYFLCSAAVIEHFPDAERSIPFKSGYEWDKESIYYILATEDYEKYDKYYHDVIEPYNKKSNVSVDFWLREACDSQVKIQTRPQRPLTQCKISGVFSAVEILFGLTTEKNIAFAIWRMAEVYGVDPITFIKMVDK